MRLHCAFSASGIKNAFSGIRLIREIDNSINKIKKTNIITNTVLETIDLGRVRKAFNLECQKIIETIVKRKSNYHDLFLIDGIKEENIVKYKKR